MVTVTGWGVDLRYSIPTHFVAEFLVPRFWDHTNRWIWIPCWAPDSSGLPFHPAGWENSPQMVVDCKGGFSPPQIPEKLRFRNYSNLPRFMTSAANFNFFFCWWWMALTSRTRNLRRKKGPIFFKNFCFFKGRLDVSVSCSRFFGKYNDSNVVSLWVYIQNSNMKASCRVSCRKKMKQVYISSLSSGEVIILICTSPACQ